MSAILKCVYVNNFKAVWRNSTELHTIDRWWEMPTPGDFRTRPPTVAPPIGHFLFYIFTFSCSFSKLLKEIHWNFALMIDGRRRIHRLVAEPTRPRQRPLVDIFILDFDFFVLIFKTVWRISMKLHTNDRQRESPYCSWFSKTLAHSSTTWRPFLFFVGHFEICLC